MRSRGRRVLLRMMMSALSLVVGCTRSGAVDGAAPLVDPRDGRAYPVVTIGGRTWMARNLDHATPESWCYGDDPSACAEEGRLYSWQAARVACPPGWRLPDDEDWLALVGAFGGHYVLADKRAIGDPAQSYRALLPGGGSGFGARLSGARDTAAAGKSADRGEDGMYWSASNRGADHVSLFVFNRQHGRVLRDEWKTDFAASVRCVKETGA